jgi:predicted Fe-Mo cluster-binding NifX family protein
MKIAITSTGKTLDSTIDERFGRCSYFVLYDTDSKSTEFIPNPSKAADEGAGLSAVEFIAGRKVSKVVSGEFGIKIKSLLESKQIQMIMLKNSAKKIGEIISMIDH